MASAGRLQPASCWAGVGLWQKQIIAVLFFPFLFSCIVFSTKLLTYYLLTLLSMRLNLMTPRKVAHESVKRFRLIEVPNIETLMVTSLHIPLEKHDAPSWAIRWNTKISVWTAQIILIKPVVSYSVANKLNYINSNSKCILSGTEVHSYIIKICRFRFYLQSISLVDLYPFTPSVGRRL